MCFPFTKTTVIFHLPNKISRLPFTTNKWDFILFYCINDDKEVNQVDFQFLSFNMFLLTDTSRNKLAVFDQNQVINLMIQFHYKLSFWQINEER
jgi:hypothetical protein